MARSFYRTPRKGTKIRRALLMCLRPEGATHIELGLQGKSALDVVANMSGWDIRGFPCPPERRNGTRDMIYKIVGKAAWSGRYRDLTDKSR